MQPRSIQFAKYTANTFVFQFLIFASVAATTILTARLLGPSGRGQLSVLTLTATIALVAGELGLGQAVIYFIGTKKLSPKEAASSTLFFQILVGAAISGILLLVTSLLSDTVYAGIPQIYVWLMIALVPFLLIKMSQQCVIQGLYKIPLYNILRTLYPAIFLILLLLLVSVVGWDLKGAVVAWIVGQMVAFIIAVLAVTKEKGLGVSGVNRGALKNLLSFGIKSYGGNFLKYMQYRVDILIVAFFLPPAEVGYYTIATMIAEGVWQIPGAIQTVLLPRIASLDKADARRWTPIICRQTILLTAIACCVLFFVANAIIPFIFGQEYLPSISPFVILLPGILILAIWKILHVDLIAQGFPLTYSFTAVVSAVTMIVLDLIFIPRWGIKGAALACTISYSLTTVLIIYFYLRKTGNSLTSILIPKPRDFALYKGFWQSLVSSLPFKSRKGKRESGQ
jgi:O-antigen/teichoic acid export membrane protein